MANLFNAKRFGILAIVALVLASASPALAGFFRVDRVEAYGVDTWTIWASSGSTEVVVRGDGDTDLDCYVYDRFGRFLGSDDDGTDFCIVNVYQRTSGNLRVRIVNRGGVWNEYRITTE